MKYHFCVKCGVLLYGDNEERTKDVPGVRDIREYLVVNAKCLNNVELEELKVEKFDGKNVF